MDTIEEVDVLSEQNNIIEEYAEEEQRVLKLMSETFIQDKLKEGFQTRPSSTPRVPTLSARAVLVRTPKASAREKSPGEDAERVGTPSDQPQSVLITELNEEFSESESDDDLSERDFKSQTIALEPVVRDSLTESKLEEYWDTDLENEGTEDEEEERVVCQYKKICTDLGIVPISYFMRHINDTHIKMRYHGLGPSAARAIALILKDDVHVEQINLDGNWIQSEGGYAISKMLEENDYLTDMGLADNKLGNEGGRYICKMLESNAGLRSLDLSGNDIDDKCADDIAGAIENCKYLKKLNLSRNKFGEISGEKFGPAIGANDRLSVIDLSWNHLRQTGACAIAKGLKENVGLKVCRAAWNGFGPEGGAAIADALATNQSLLELDISGNRLNLTTAERIARSFKTNDTLKILHMGNNLITTAGAIALVTAINANENCELEVLDLTDVPVEYEFLRIIEDIKVKKPDFKVVHGPVLRSGNTSNDLVKRAIDPYKTKQPVIILNEHVVVNDLRLVDILARYDPTGNFSVSPEDFLAALDELAVPYNKPQLQEALGKIAKDQSGRIYLGDALQNKTNKETKQLTFPKELS